MVGMAVSILEITVARTSQKSRLHDLVLDQTDKWLGVNAYEFADRLYSRIAEVAAQKLICPHGST
jgi:hypothetical protein